MNTLQNPSFPQPAYGYGNSMGQPETMPQFQSDFSQTQLQQLTTLPNTSQRPPQFAQQPQGQTPSHLYQQYQQQHNQQHPGPSAQLQNRGALALAQGTYYGQQSRHSPVNPHQRQQSASFSGNGPNESLQAPAPMFMQQSVMQQGHTAAQIGQNSSSSQISRNPPLPSSSAMNPQAVAREEERVTTLLEINSHLIQEVMALQAQGKAGSSGQRSPTSPTSGIDASNAGSNSPSDPSKRQPSSQEYADCMRRLQANLAYLAAIADANKKASGARPVGPAIMIPPPHLTSVNGLYQKLKTLFPEASQTTLNKAMAVVNAQAARNSPMHAQGVS